MRNFEIVCASGRRKTPVGHLSYDEAKKEATIAIAHDAKVGHVPAMFNYYLEQGEYLIDANWTRKWIGERVPPESRHNIDEILKGAGLQEYDPYALLFYTQGHSGQDEFFLREIKGGESSESAEASRYEYAVVSLRQEVGCTLAKARSDAGFTQEELARKTGIQQSIISKIERGKANPTLETIACLANALGLRADLALRLRDETRCMDMKD